MENTSESAPAARRCSHTVGIGLAAAKNHRFSPGAAYVEQQHTNKTIILLYPVSVGQPLLNVSAAGKGL